MHKNCLGCPDNKRKKTKMQASDPLQINKEPTIKYSEEIYKSLLAEHDLTDESSNTSNAYETPDPLALDGSDIQESSQINKKLDNEQCTQKEILTENDFEVIEIKCEIDDNLEMELENQPEFVKIEIVEDETELYNLNSSEHYYQQPTENQHPSTNKDVASVKFQTEQNSKVSKNIPSRTQKRDKQNVHPVLEFKDLASTELKTDLPLSAKDFSSIELNFTSNDNLNDRTVIPSDVLDACEKCMENTLYMAEKISDPKNNRSKIILVLIKLKDNLPCDVLGTMLGLKENICGIIFYYALEILAVALKPAVCWFTGKELKNGKAKCFDDLDYNHIRVILHELTFEVQKCNKTQCDVKLCEKYKKHDSIKVIIGISPKGNLFSYVSNPYDSSFSIDSVLRKEKFFSHLCYRGDIVVIAKALETSLIHENCRREGISIQRLDGVKNEVRDYVERIIQKVEDFEIVKSKLINSHMVPFIGKAVHVICSVLNLKFEAENIEKMQ